MAVFVFCHAGVLRVIRAIRGLRDQSFKTILALEPRLGAKRRKPDAEAADCTEVAECPSRNEPKSLL